MKISLATKVLWSLVVGYVAIAFLSAILETKFRLDLILAENFGLVFFGALALQFIIYTTNQFLFGLKE